MAIDVAVIGLGSMGQGMAASLVRAGCRTWGDDAVAARVERVRREGGQPEPVSQVAAELDAVVVVVLNAAQTEAVLFGDDGLAPRLRKGAVVVSCVTVSPEFARAMEARCVGAGLLYLDAPISGGSARAAQGRLTVMASGAPAAFAAARPVLEATAETGVRARRRCRGRLGDEGGEPASRRCPHRGDGRGVDLRHYAGGRAGDLP